MAAAMDRMMAEAPPTDQTARDRALDTGHSWIVQAPAGSGKTGLLTQRYLALLARVEEPEEILAITFTRKAAAEMRNRVLGALDWASGPPPADPFGLLTWRLARAADERDRQLGWQLAASPSRLRIQTFDSLSHGLARQLPLSTALGATPIIVDDPLPGYQQAARRTLDALETPGSGDAVATLLRHLDNDRAQLEGLLCAMLARRDQWLRVSAQRPDADVLVEGLCHAVEAHLRALQRHCDASWLSRLAQIAWQAAEQRRLAGEPDAAAALPGPAAPGPQWAALGHWRVLAGLLLTAQGLPRKSWNKRQGFPAPGDRGIDAAERERRAAAKAAIEDLAAVLREDAELAGLWTWVNRLPPHLPNEDQHALLDALLQVLHRAAAELEVGFAEQGELDFPEVQLRALRALGTAQAPSDLTLRLDYRLQHLLVDEFQDTSVGQYELLETLTAGWTGDDGRTLFLVGDPMQSIYRFREAEVGLFLRAWRHGLGGVPLGQLRLSANFRSSADLVDWVNGHLVGVLPPRSDPARGAVAFVAATPQRPTAGGPAVTLHGWIDDDRAAEAARAVDVVRAALAETRDGEIAILARARSHLAEIARALTRADIGFSAVDIDPLTTRPVVQDLRALTRALLHPGDRLAWLTVLHSPWIGLSLDGLVRIAEGFRGTLPARLRQAEVVEALDTDDRRRVARLLDALDRADPSRGRRPLRQRVEGIWLALGGLASTDATGEADAAAFLDLLDELDQAGGLRDLEALDRAVATLYATPDATADGRVRLMTMHKAKGLEFDTVILPGLGRPPASEPRRLLYWMERATDEGRTELLMAPIRAADADSEPIADYLRALDREKQVFESGRLLYVAVTRARRRLHLLGHLTRGPGDPDGRPRTGSLLAQLWPVLGDAFVDRAEPAGLAGSGQPGRVSPGPRLAADWRPGGLPAMPTPPMVSVPEPRAIEFSWAGSTARHVGTVVHRQLERIARDGVSRWPADRVDGLRPTIELALAQLGVDADELPGAVDKAQRALRSTLGDDKGRWLLEGGTDARCEWPLTRAGDPPGQYVIDRSFVDDDGVRWIVDYKTGDHQGGDVEHFLDEERARYREQLETYAQLVRQLEDRPIRLALYFPLFAAWRTWDFDG
jgi:ATP-dependent exoDNAse (exonuclease V) beta subunit